MTEYQQMLDHVNMLQQNLKAAQEQMDAGMRELRAMQRKLAETVEVTQRGNTVTLKSGDRVLKATKKHYGEVFSVKGTPGVWTLKSLRVAVVTGEI